MGPVLPAEGSPPRRRVFGSRSRRPKPDSEMFNPDLKRGSLELLILSSLEAGKKHGYEIGKELERRSEGRLEFKASTLYSILYRMEDRRWIKGRWVEKRGERRRCYYTLTTAGRSQLASQRAEWREFSKMVDRILRPETAGATS